MHTKQRIGFCMVIALLLVAGSVFAQDEPTGDGKLVSIGFSMENLSAGELQARTGVVLEEFLGLGVLWGLGFDTVGGAAENDLSVGIWCNAALLKEDEFVPVSVDVTADFTKSRTNGSDLRSNDLMKSSTGYSIGLHAAKLFTLSEGWQLEAALVGNYVFNTVTTEAIPGSGSPSPTVIESTADYIYGIDVIAGVALNEAMRFQFGLLLHLNSDFHIIYGPTIGLAAK